MSVLGKSCGSDPSLALSRDFGGPQRRVSPREVTAPGGSPGNHIVAVCPAKDRPVFRKLASFCESCQDGEEGSAPVPPEPRRRTFSLPERGHSPGTRAPAAGGTLAFLLCSQTMTAPLGVLDATVDERDARRGALLSDGMKPPSGAGSQGSQGSLGVASAALGRSSKGTAAASERRKQELTEQRRGSASQVRRGAHALSLGTQVGCCNVTQYR